MTHVVYLRKFLTGTSVHTSEPNCAMHESRHGTHLCLGYFACPPSHALVNQWSSSVGSLGTIT